MPRPTWPYADNFVRKWLEVSGYIPLWLWKWMNPRLASGLSYANKPTPMIKNYLTTTVRNILKRKGFSLLNIVGLAIGLSASLLILQYVKDELSYDDFHANADRIYRVQFDAYRKRLPVTFLGNNFWIPMRIKSRLLQGYCWLACW